MGIDIYKLGEKYNLTESEEMALKFIVNNINLSLKIGVRGVAKECFASTSVVMNLAKKLEYKGFIEMIYRLEEIIKKNKCNAQNNLCINYSEKLKKDFLKILEENKHKPIYCHGTGFSKHIIAYLKDKLMILGFFASLSEYMECVQKENFESVLIVVSKSGETNAILNLCQKAKKNNITLISFTGVEKSSISDISDISFVIKNSNLLDDRNIEQNDFFGNTILFFESLMNN